MSDFEFISPLDRPALLAISTPEWAAMATTFLKELGYKVHSVQNDSDFIEKYGQVHFELVIIEQNFTGVALSENPILHYIQKLPMSQRRHAVFLLIGDSFGTLNGLVAFQQSVHAVINYSEMALLGQLIQKVVSDNQLFLAAYLEAQKRAVSGTR
ncbi:MAG: hypothetical protein JWN25_657 [Verrucomicrobiales bacterium]|nr:hypothetical protein [Verrucomicrobiales bacterium]